MRKTTTKGFTLIELLVVISIIALLIGILLPALGAARRTANQMKSNTQVRGIHQGMVTFANGNKGKFPGIGRPDTNNDGFVDNEVDGNSKNLQAGYFVERRYYELMEGNYFSGDLAISPVESKTTWTTGQVKKESYSYAMLKIRGGTLDADPGGPDPDAGGNQPNTGRKREWQDTLNTEALVISDRNTGPGITDDQTGSNGVKSIHTTKEGDWNGSLGWNDGHVEFSKEFILRTKYATAPAVVDNNGDPGDNLFDHDLADDPNDPAAGLRGYDAYMVYSDLSDPTSSK